MIPLVAGLILVLAAAAAGWFFGVRNATTIPPVYHQLTFDRGLIYAARFAPGGRSIYYSAAWKGQPVQIYSTVPDSPESRPLNLLNSTLFATSPLPNWQFRSDAMIAISEIAKALWPPCLFPVERRGRLLKAFFLRTGLPTAATWPWSAKWAENIALNFLAAR